MRQHAHEVLPGLGLCRVEFAPDVLQRYQPLLVAADNVLRCRQGQLVINTLDRKRNELAAARNGFCHGVVKTGAELSQVAQPCDVRRAE